MKNLNESSTKLSKIDKWYVPLMMVLSFGGFIDATYLTISYFKGASLVCNFSTGCNQVTSSAYSTVFGLPVALLGLGFYVTVLVLTVAYFDWRKDWLPKIILGISTLAFGFSLWFVWVMIFVIKAFCQYCLVSAVLSTAIFGASVIRYRLGRIES